MLTCIRASVNQTGLWCIWMAQEKTWVSSSTVMTREWIIFNKEIPWQEESVCPEDKNNWLNGWTECLSQFEKKINQIWERTRLLYQSSLQVGPPCCATPWLAHIPFHTYFTLAISCTINTFRKYRAKVIHVECFVRRTDYNVLSYPFQAVTGLQAGQCFALG